MQVLQEIKGELNFNKINLHPRCILIWKQRLKQSYVHTLIYSRESSSRFQQKAKKLSHSYKPIKTQGLYFQLQNSANFMQLHLVLGDPKYDSTFIKLVYPISTHIIILQKDLKELFAVLEN